MMKRKIVALIVDDAVLERRRVRRLLSADTEIEIVGECANGREAIAAIRTHSPDLVFLDVQMPPGIDGFRVLEAVDQEKMPLVIFVTGYDEYALRALATHPVDYLLKPYDDSRFQAALSTAKRRLRTEQYAAMYEMLLEEIRNSPDRIPAGQPDTSQAKTEPHEKAYPEYLLIRENGRERFIKVADINWIKAEDKYVALNIARGTKLLHHEAISVLAKRLDPKQFLRIHRSSIVNINNIREIIPLSTRKYEVVLHDGTKLDMSRSRHKRLFANS
jgi:two-component system LytT family response regulator